METLEQERLELEIDSQTLKQYENSTMSKAGKLAMELAQEKRRLVKELEELQVEYEGVKPTTPTGTLDWYVKWTAIIFAVLGIFLISSGLTVPGQSAYIISGIGWIFVGMQWSDRAIMIGSSVTTTAVAMNLMEYLLLT